MSDNLATIEKPLFARLTALGIETKTTRHPAVFTVTQSQQHRGLLSGDHCKTLFLKDKTQTLWLLVADESRHIDLKSVAKAVGAGRLSFCKPKLMNDVLGVQPGAVTPFALINENARGVRVILDKSMLRSKKLNYHPLHNEATTTISPEDLLLFIRSSGHEPVILDFDANCSQSTC